MHEARHADGKGHNGGTTCGNGGSCDTTWAYNGASRYHVLYMWWLSACADSVMGTTSGFRNQVVTAGNALWNRFNTRPSRADVFGAGVSNPTGPALIPPASVCPPL